MYSIYLVMTAAQVVLLLFGGMDFYEALCVSFGTAGTGGFSIWADGMQTMGGANYNYCIWVITVFMLLFSVKSPADIQDSSIIQTTQDLFTINRDPAFPGASQESPGNPPLRVIVKDAFFCSCLSDILRFIYSGTLSNGSGTASGAFEMKCAPGLHVLPVGFIFLFFVLSEVKIVNAIVSALSTGTGPSFLSLQVSLP